MKTFTIGEILKAVNGRLLYGDENACVTGFSIDSREISAENMFFPTIGEKSDAHDFIGQVIGKGCRALTVSNPEKIPAGFENELNVIVVDDTLKALQDLAAHYLNTLPLKKK